MMNYSHGSAARVVVGTRVDATSYAQAVAQIAAWVEQGRSAYVVAANVHVLMTAWWHPEFRPVLAAADLVTPDGMPLVWALKLLGIPGATRVYGPDLMLALCEHCAREGIPIYLYGSTEMVLARLQENLTKRFPGLWVVGSQAPPFRPLTPGEESQAQEQIRASGAKVIFIGLGCPKQEQLMARWRGAIPGVMVGVGAAFNFHSGTVPQAPRWLMGLGLEWLYRWWQEPRLWRRYLLNNPLFLILCGAQILAYWLQPPRHPQP
ncbi:MAG: WecB/TagA/CpsF family glycosyltransferase [Thermostichales cyanobacterium BF3_bins_165]